MADKNFFKDNFVLIVGLALPVLLMIGFMVVSSLPPSGEAPKYDLVFSTYDYRNGTGLPITVNLVVKDGVLKAQYTQVKDKPSYNNQWNKIYLFDAETQKVRELSFGLPADADKITGMREEVVEATKDLKLSTELKSPDGYELGNGYYRHGGLFNELFWGWGSHSGEAQISNGSRSIRLSTSDGRTYFSSYDPRFIGWVVK